jgi:putative FmdB family regulatory protein
LTYEYLCSCSHRFDVIKGVADLNREEKCPQCQAVAERQFSFRVHITGARVTHAEYNPGLGQVVKSKYHKEELCKRMGVVEVGNDFRNGEKMQKEFDTARADKREKRWNEDD